MRIKYFFKSLKKIAEFEYWPFGVFYIPLYFYGFYLAFKAKSLMYFSSTNPSMKYGGVMGESKIKVLNNIPEEYLPKTLFFEANITIRQILYGIESKMLSFPIIVKPNIGERGKGVEKIEDEKGLSAYFEKHSNQDIIVQEFIEAPVELGVLYYRFPNETTGNIKSVVLKEFLAVKGNGQDTLKTLILKNTRAKNRLTYLFEKYSDILHEVLPNGKDLYLEPIGNHSRGTKFLNGNHLINDQLITVFDRIAKRIEGYNYGRFDLKVSSIEALYRGKDIKILELNGVSSEPAHIYDPSTKLWNAYKDLFAHASIIQQIGIANHRNGVPYDNLKTFTSELVKFIFPQKKNTTHSANMPHPKVTH